jgi:hypothetical protein
VPQWLRNLVMLTVLSAWLAVVAVSLFQGKVPDAAVLGVPAAVVLALAPPGVLTLRRNRARSRGENPDDEESNT